MELAALLVSVFIVIIVCVVLCYYCSKICQYDDSKNSYPSHIRRTYSHRNDLQQLQREVGTKRIQLRNYQRTLNQRKACQQRYKELNKEIERKQINLSSSQEVKDDVYKLFTKLLLEKMRHYLHEILTVTFSVPNANKETYKAFGMLLSACQMRHDISQSYSEVIEKVIQNISLEKEFIIVEKSVSLSRAMLTLLPPLLVLQPPNYDEEMHEICRKTWDETKDNFTLYYYRPVLFYGKSNSVAVKGRVGNSKVELLED